MKVTNRNGMVDEFHAAVYDFLETLIAPVEWAELAQSFIDERKTRGYMADTMPIFACLALGGQAESAIPAAASWILYTAAGRIFDDIQDSANGASGAKQDRITAMNQGLCLLSLAGMAILHAEDEEAAREIMEQGAYTFAAAAAAQDAGKRQAHLPTEEECFAIIFRKTGNFVATALWSGAYLSGPDPDPNHLDAVYNYGLSVGIMSQLEDDCRDLEQDIANGTLTLPVVYAAANQSHPQHAALSQLLAGDPAANAAETAVLVTQMGGVQRTMEMAGMYLRQANTALDSLPDSVAKMYLKETVLLVME